MFSGLSPRMLAISQAAFVTFLWSTSWVLIKLGISADLPPLTFAGLRYTLAFLCLLPLLLRRRAALARLGSLPRRDWLRLVLLGVLLYTVTQGAQFIGLEKLPTMTVSLLLSFTAIVVAFLGIWLLGEKPTMLQWGGIGLYLAGALIYFYPVIIPQAEILGMAVVIGGVTGGSLAVILGRSLNQHHDLTPLIITVISMGIGGTLLLISGVITEGLPVLTPTTWLIIGWLAVVNTAYAFTLWNQTLKTLSALESSIINNLMMIQIPVMAWVFLGEALTLKVIIGLALAGMGIILVQFRRVAFYRLR